MVKLFVLSTAVMALGACATTGKPARGPDIVRINPASLAADPARWDGRQVEVVGLLVWEADNAALYQSYGAYCRGAEKAAIHVDWASWPAVSRKDSRRRVIVRGTFRNLIAAPGPGPLEPGAVFGWLSNPAKPCPRALP